MSRRVTYCSFCGKPDSEVQVMVTDRYASICDECVELCVHVVRSKNGELLDEVRRLGT